MNYSVLLIDCVLQIKVENWCQTIDKAVQLSDVEREAQKFKKYINPLRLSIEEKKRKLNTSTSPESAYSSGSGNSPVFDFLSVIERHILIDLINYLTVFVIFWRNRPHKPNQQIIAKQIKTLII